MKSELEEDAGGRKQAVNTRTETDWLPTDLCVFSTLLAQIFSLRSIYKAGTD